jgi:ribosomal protein L37AE/L43A
VLTFGQDKKRLGGELGATLVLHTWGQALDLHPHLHCIVPGGALATDSKWVVAKSNYLFPVKAMANFFKRCFLTELKQLFHTEQLQFHGQAVALKQSRNFKTLCDTLWNKSWVVYAKPPFANAQTVVRYLGRYTHRIAIANHRLVSIDNGKVTFHWRDYRDNNQQKVMTLSTEEFIRRFLLHVLPNGFTRIGHIGFLANRYKAKKLKQCCDALEHQQTPCQKETVEQILLRVANLDIWQCKHCGNGKKQIVLTLYNNSHTKPINPKVA